MAGKTIEMELLLKSNVSKTTAETKALNKELEKAQRTASQTSAVKSAPKSISSASDPDAGLKRGTTGVGGGNDSKDFARQAQGLGGLVHVYATFAANIFAVTAAFTALSKAADYTNMVEGLNQLGAASGKNLGFMAQNVVRITDGAVSLKQSMESVAQSSSAGLSGTQMERLANVAKKTSQALGRDVGDSLNRLSRGISKIEPELLDELGIMVRVDKAAEDYARTIGKSTASLTDFEKRQAFANAVLKQGEDKFNSIELSANSYSKLLATFTNVALKAGESLNKVLGPIATLLANNPTALAATLALITTTLLSKAIPAMGQWRESLKATADQAAKTAERAAQAHEAFKINKEVKAGAIIMDPLNAQLGATKAKLQELLVAALPKNSKLLSNVTSDSFDAKKELPKYEAAIKRMTKELNVLGEARKAAGVTPAQLALMDQAIEKTKNSTKEMTAAVAVTKDHLAVQEKMVVASDAIDAKSAKGGFFEKILKYKAASAAQSALSTSILNQVGQNTLEMGPLDALKNLWKDIRTETDLTGKKLNGVRATFTLVSGSARILATSLMTVAAAFGNILMAIGVFTIAFQMLDKYFSTSAKYIEDYNSSLESVDSSVKTLVDTLAHIGKQDALKGLSPTTIDARANALKGVSDAASQVVKEFEKIRANQNGWDRGVDFLASIFNSSSVDKMAERLSLSIRSVMERASNSVDKEATQKELEGLLGKDQSLEGLKSATYRLGKSGDTETLDKVVELIGKLTLKTKAASSASMEFKETTKDTEKQLQSMITSFNPTDAVSKFGLAQIESSHKFGLALQDPISAIATLSEVVQDFNQLKLFSDESRTALLNEKTQIVEISQAMAKYDKEIDAIIKKKADLEASGKSHREQTAFKEIPTSNPNVTERQTTRVKIETKAFTDLNKEQKALEDKRATKSTEINPISARMMEVSLREFGVGVEKVSRSLEIAGQNAAIAISKASLTGMSGPGTTQANLTLQLRSIDTQESLINSNLELIMAIEKARIQAEEDTILRKGPPTAADSTRLDDIKKMKGALSSKDPYTEIKALGNTLAYELKSSWVASAGASVEKRKLAGERGAVQLTAEFSKEDERLKAVQDIKKAEIEVIKVKESQLSTLQKFPLLYSTDLALQLNSLATNRESKELELEIAALKNIENKAELARQANKEDPKQLAEIEKSAAHNIFIQNEKIAKMKKDNQTAEIARTRSMAEQEIAYLEEIFVLEQRNRRAKNAVENQRSTNRSAAIDNQSASGIITDTQATTLRERIALEQNARDFTDENIQLTRVLEAAKDKSNADRTAALSTLNSEQNQSYEEWQAGADRITRAYEAQAELRTTELNSAQEVNKLKVELIKSQAAYQRSLTETEDTMRSMEKLGLKNPGEYFGALADDFNNKLGQMIKAAKSAGDTFNQGLISAVDTTIDKFFDTMQKSELNFNDMVKFARNALSDVFRDTASQLAKNAWKDLAKDIMGPSKIETEAKAAADASAALQQSLANNTVTLVDQSAKANTLLEKIADKTGESPSDKTGESPSGIPEQLGYTDEQLNRFGAAPEVPEDGVLREAGKKQEYAAVTQLTTAELGKKTTEGFMSDSAKVLSGEMTVAQLFKNTVSSFGPLFNSFITGLWGAIQGLGGGGGGGGGGGIFGTIIKAFTGGSGEGGVSGAFNQAIGADVGVGEYFGDALRLAAKGDVFSGAAGLSAYSNSIVSSPTMFAFAKGGTPSRGLMGEAGPEAIIPLKRDSSGNLGVSGGGSNVNNVEITINIEQGQVKNTNSSGLDQASMASQLGNIIKTTVTQELIRQSRPGGLLAK